MTYDEAQELRDELMARGYVFCVVRETGENTGQYMVVVSWGRN